MRIRSNIAEIIGNTPILRINNVIKDKGIKSDLLVKLEYLNPTGSVKDRAAKFMIEDALRSGLIKENATIIEPTSGNTGIGLASIGASLNLKVILTMPDTMSVERIKLLKAYGAEVVLTEGKKGMIGAIEKAKEIQTNTLNSFIPSQFDNPSNVNAHYFTTGPEIWEDTDGKIDVFVSCIGTGGTLSGVSKYLKGKNDNIETVGVEPTESPLITKGDFGAHKIQGIGANFIPENFYSNYVDKVVTVSGDDAYSCAKYLAKSEGVLVGISSGAALFAAIELSKKPEYQGKTILALLPDSGDRYLSTELFTD